MTVTTLSPTEMHRTVATMERHGGGFCSRLAAAWYLADRSNRARIEEAFAHILVDYAPGSRFYSNAD